VKDALHASDPLFRPWEAATRRNVIIVERSREHNHQQLEASIARIPNGTIRTILMQRVDAEKNTSEQNEGLFLRSGKRAIFQDTYYPEPLRLGYEEGSAYLDTELRKDTDALSHQEQYLFTLFGRLLRQISDMRRIESVSNSDVDKRIARLLEDINDTSIEFAKQLDCLEGNGARLVNVCGRYPEMIRSAAKIYEASARDDEHRSDSQHRVDQSLRHE
jgi:phosphoribosylpyrophosphate synthetase